MADALMTTKVTVAFSDVDISYTETSTSIPGSTPGILYAEGSSSTTAGVTTYYWSVTPGTVNNLPVSGTGTPYTVSGSGYIILTYSRSSGASISGTLQASVPEDGKDVCYVNIGYVNGTTGEVKPYVNGSLTITVSGNLWDKTGLVASSSL